MNRSVTFRSLVGLLLVLTASESASTQSPSIVDARSGVVSTPVHLVWPTALPASESPFYAPVSRRYPVQFEGDTTSHRHRLRNVLIGAATGGVVGATIGARRGARSDREQCVPECGGPPLGAPLYGFIFGVVGMALGGVVGFLWP